MLGEVECGMGRSTEESLRAGMKARVPEEEEEIEGMWFGVFTKRFVSPGPV